MAELKRYRRRRGIVFDDNGKARMMIAIPTGQMADGSLVWTECNADRELIDEDTQYLLFTRGGWSMFEVL